MRATGDSVAAIEVAVATHGSVSRLAAVAHTLHTLCMVAAVSTFLQNALSAEQ